VDTTAALLVVDVAKKLTPAYRRSLAAFMGDLAHQAARREAEKMADELTRQLPLVALRHEPKQAETAQAEPRGGFPMGPPSSHPAAPVAATTAQLEAQLAARVGASLSLVLNKTDLVVPKLRLLPLVAEVHDLLVDAVKASAARVVREEHGQTHESHVPRSSEKKARETARTAKRKGNEAEMAFEVFLVSAKADLDDAQASGLGELRSFLHQAAVPRPWDMDDIDDEDEDDDGDGANGANDDGDGGIFEDEEKKAAEEGAAGADGGGSAGGRGCLRRPLHKQATAKLSYDRVSSELGDAEWAEECVREKAFAFLHKVGHYYYSTCPKC
jgi:hypothetical protein